MLAGEGGGRALGAGVPETIGQGGWARNRAGQEEYGSWEAPRGAWGQVGPWDSDCSLRSDTETTSGGFMRAHWLPSCSLYPSHDHPDTTVLGRKATNGVRNGEVLTSPGGLCFSAWGLGRSYTG